MVRIPVRAVFSWFEWPPLNPPYERSDWNNLVPDDEPDTWRNQTEKGFIELILRNNTGHLCGYVGVPEYARNYSFIKSGGEGLCVDVHGGITFSSIKVDYPGFWFIGFDCAHAGDSVPGMQIGEGTYRTVGYVKSEVASLLLQLMAL